MFNLSLTEAQYLPLITLKCHFNQSFVFLQEKKKIVIESKYYLLNTKYFLYSWAIEVPPPPEKSEKQNKQNPIYLTQIRHQG